MHVAGPQKAALEIAELVEHEQGGLPPWAWRVC
jgi:hypothetical protein